MNAALMSVRNPSKDSLNVALDCEFNESTKHAIFFSSNNGALNSPHTPRHFLCLLRDRVSLFFNTKAFITSDD